MQLTILGSAAAEAFPAMFCACPVCREAWRRGGRNLRRRTSYLLNHDTLVDFGPDSHYASQALGLDLSAVTQLLFTHSHADHCTPGELFWRHDSFGHVAHRLAVYGNRQVLARLEGEGECSLDAMSIDYQVVQASVGFTAGACQVLPLEANHAGPDEQALNYLLRDEGGALLIANDTGWWPDETWDAVAGQAADAAVIECTYGVGQPDARQGHLGGNVSLAFRDRLFELGALRPGATVLVNHFTHNGAGLHEELCDFFEPHGVQVGYDGLGLDVTA